MLVARDLRHLLDLLKRRRVSLRRGFSSRSSRRRSRSRSPVSGFWRMQSSSARFRARGRLHPAHLQKQTGSRNHSIRQEFLATGVIAVTPVGSRFLPSSQPFRLAQGDGEGDIHPHSVKATSSLAALKKATEGGTAPQNIRSLARFLQRRIIIHHLFGMPSNPRASVVFDFPGVDCMVA